MEATGLSPRKSQAPGPILLRALSRARERLELVRLTLPEISATVPSSDLVPHRCAKKGLHACSIR